MSGSSEKLPSDKPNVVLLHSSDFLDWLTGMVEMTLEKTQIRGKVGKPLARKFMNWGMRWAMWPIHFGIMCCALEMAVSATPRYDTTRLGMIYRSSPRQCDILLLNGPVSKKLKPSVLRLWEQMPEPKWVIAMGECAISGGPYYNSYSIIPGVDQFLPVDIYVPGCPARPEALIDAFLKLQDRILEHQNKSVWRLRSVGRDEVDAERRKRVEAKLAEKAERYKKKPKKEEKKD